jgi:hypothetical protein
MPNAFAAPPADGGAPTNWAMDGAEVVGAAAVASTGGAVAATGSGASGTFRTANPLQGAPYRPRDARAGCGTSSRISGSLSRCSGGGLGPPRRPATLAIEKTVTPAFSRSIGRGSRSPHRGAAGTRINVSECAGKVRPNDVPLTATGSSRGAILVGSATVF